jgi:hypothetical protein
MFENREMGKILRPERKEETGSWRKFNHNELYNIVACRPIAK